jgi:hypothetical protein
MLTYFLFYRKEAQRGIDDKAILILVSLFIFACEIHIYGIIATAVSWTIGS